MWLETKYRAWEEKYKTMYYEDELGVTVLGNIYENKELINSLTKEEVSEINDRGEF